MLSCHTTMRSLLLLMLAWCDRAEAFNWIPPVMLGKIIVSVSGLVIWITLFAGRALNCAGDADSCGPKAIPSRFWVILSR